MKTRDLLKKINGLQTIDSIMQTLNINKDKAIYLVHRLRKKGYVKTSYNSVKKRIYYISSENALGGTSYVEILNKYSPVKISSSEVYKVYGRSLSIEETLIYAIKSKVLRYILSALALYKRKINWSEMYRLAKHNNLLREIGALYDLARINIKQIKRMNKGYRNRTLPKDKEKYLFIILNLQSADFKEIEKRWRVYLPFNKEDLEDYKK